MNVRFIAADPLQPAHRALRALLTPANTEFQIEELVAAEEKFQFIYRAEYRA
jgi:hypothetical protein